MSIMPKLDEINKTVQNFLGRYKAVMALPDIFFNRSWPNKLRQVFTAGGDGALLRRLVP